MSAESSETGIPEEELEHLKEEYQREHTESKESEKTPLGEVSKLVDESLKEEPKDKLFPISKETDQFVEEEGRFLNDKQRELLHLSAYFYEKDLESFLSLVKGEKNPLEEESSTYQTTLKNLTLRYEDILERTEEYPAAREMIKELQDYIFGIEKMPYFQSSITVRRNLTERINGFNAFLAAKEATSEESKIRTSHLFQTLRPTILGRSPVIEQEIPKETQTPLFERMVELTEWLKSANEAGAPDEEQEPIREELDETFDQLLSSLEASTPKNKESSIKAPLSKEEGKALRDEMEFVVDQEGSEYSGGKGVHIELEDDKDRKMFKGERIEIWYPKSPESEETPVHITIEGAQIQPISHLVLDKDGTITAYKNNKDSFEELRRFEENQWRDFLSQVSERVRQGTEK